MLELNASYSSRRTTRNRTAAWRPPIGAVIDTMNDTLFTPGAWSSTVDPATLAAISAGPLTPYTMNVTVASGLPGTMTILKDATREPVGIFGSQINSTYSGGTASPTADVFTVWKVTINEHAAPYSPYPNLSWYTKQQPRIYRHLRLQERHHCPNYWQELHLEHKHGRTS